MHSPDVSLGFGSVVYALSKLDGNLQPEELKVIQKVLPEEPYGDLAVCGFFLRDNAGYSVAEAYHTGLKRMAGEDLEPSKPYLKRFVSILLRVARAHEGVSREERAFIRKFWKDLLQLQSQRPQDQTLLNKSFTLTTN